MSTSLSVRSLSPVEFSAQVVPALSERDAENGLPIGIAFVCRYDAHSVVPRIQ